MHPLARGTVEPKVGLLDRGRTELLLSGSVCVKADERLVERGDAWVRCNCVYVTVESVSSMYTPFQRPIRHPVLKMRSTIYKDDVSHKSLIVYGLN